MTNGREIPIIHSDRGAHRTAKSCAYYEHKARGNDTFFRKIIYRIRRFESTSSRVERGAYRHTRARRHPHVCPEDFGQNKAFFLVGYECGTPICCAGVRVLDDETGEVKRVYARTRSRGVGAAQMAAVEDEARALGYRRLVLECRGGNPRAIAFYLRNGYSVCPNHPPYDVESDAVCMEKYL